MTGRRRALTAGLPLLALLALARPASGHQSSLAYSSIVVDGNDVEYTIEIANADLYEAVGVDRDRPVTRDEVRAGEQRLFAYLGSRLRVEERGDPCPPAPGGLRFLDKSDGFFVAASIRFRCPRPIADARIRYDLFFDLDPRHQGIARIAFGDEEGREQVFRDQARTLELRRELTVWDHVREYLRLGVEHIFTGYDHIAFLFGLLIVAGAHGLRQGARKILGVVTAFTIAHSVTLIASALGSSLLTPLRVVPAVALGLAAELRLARRAIPAPTAIRIASVIAAALVGYLVAAGLLHALPALRPDPSKIIEASIALSIVYVGVENLVAEAPSHRFLLTFCFGLVHGFGFASVLREIGLPEKGLLLSLLSFNLGVELGQLGVVAAVLPLLALVAQPRHRPVALELAVLAAVALATVALFRQLGTPVAPLLVVTFGGAPLLYGLGRRFGYDRVVRLGGSSVIAAFAAYWFLERVSGRTWLGGWLG